MNIRRTWPAGAALMVAACACLSLTFAQPQPPLPPSTDSLQGLIESLRADLRSGKVRTINQVMKLSDAEDAVFWPIYHDYEDDYFALGEDRIALIKDYLKAHAAGQLTNERARALTEASFKFQTDRIELMKKYESIMRERLSALRASEFVQIESRFSLIVDLMIASEVPLVSPAPAKEELPAKDYLPGKD